jgi:release factor glutamine methyltransferase
MLVTPGLDGPAVEGPTVGKRALSHAKACQTSGEMAEARQAYAAARHAFERAGLPHANFAAAVGMRLGRFRARHPHPGLDAPKLRHLPRVEPASLLPFPGSASAGRALVEKPREMWSSKILLRQNEQITKPTRVEFHDLRFVVNPNVFSPAVFPDTPFFAANIPFRSGEKVLEIGSGTGMIAALAALHGARLVVATDVNPDAVANTAENFAAHGVTSVAEARQGDVFSPVGKDEFFDTIWWNVPFMHCDKQDLSMLEKALYDPGYEALERYLAGAKGHLAPGGHVLIGFSTTHGHMEVLQELAVRYGWKLKVLAEQETRLPPTAEGAERIAVQLFEVTPVGKGAKEGLASASAQAKRLE